MSARKFATILAVIFFTAFYIRVVSLEKRPMHGDEANQAYRTGLMLQGEVYQYDPHDHHGPTLYFCTLPVLRLLNISTFAQTREFHFRIIPVLFGLLTILFLPLMLGAFEQYAILGGALFMAISPAMVYYNRYYIQESLLVLFSFIFLASLWRYVISHKLRWAVLAGASAGLMHATKETCILVYAACVGALAILFFTQGRLSLIKFRKHLAAIAIILMVGVAVSVTLYSAFFKNPTAIIDSVAAYKNYVTRGTDTAGIHIHPWYYYFQILLFTHKGPGPIWSEIFPIVLAAIATFIAHYRTLNNNRRDSVRFLSYYTFLLTFFYSAIPYKTPWCLLGFWHGFLMLAGVGLSDLLRLSSSFPKRTTFVIFLLAGLAHYARLTYLTNFVYPADVRNPYVYAHTSTAILRLRDRVEGLSSCSEKGQDLSITVIADQADYWPLPWYFRSYKNVGYWTVFPENVDSDVIVVASGLAKKLEEKLTREYHSEFHALRPNALLKVYIDKQLWQRFLERQS